MGLFGSAPFVLLALLLFGTFGTACGGDEQSAVSRLPFQQATDQVDQANWPVERLAGRSVDRPLDRSVERAAAQADRLANTAPGTQSQSAQSQNTQFQNTQPQHYQPAQLEVLHSFEQAMTAYRIARSQPVRPDFALLELTHTPQVVAELQAALHTQRDNRIALRYEQGPDFSAKYASVSITAAGGTVGGGAIGDGVGGGGAIGDGVGGGGAIGDGAIGGGAIGDGATGDGAEVSGCTHYQATEFDSSNGSDLDSVDEKVSFSARLVRNPNAGWLLAGYTTYPLDDWGQKQCI